MIEVLTFNNTKVGEFDNYYELFDCLITIENLKLVAKHIDFRKLNWSFTVYSPKRVAALYTYTKNPPEAVKDAFEEKLSLLEICTGDYKNPEYITMTPNVNMSYLRKKWCMDYCAFHHLTIREV